MVNYTGPTGNLQKDNSVKHLKIEYTTESGSTITLYDQSVNEVTWTDGPNGIKVEGKTAAAASGGMSGLLGLLSGASKPRADALAEAGKPTQVSNTAPQPQVIEVDPAEVIPASHT
jgi:hypothetical protein